MFNKKIKFKVTGMKCEHCAKKVEDGISNLLNVKSVKVFLDKQEVVVKYHDEIDINKIKERIEELGYSVIDE